MPRRNDAKRRAERKARAISHEYMRRVVSDPGAALLDAIFGDPDKCHFDRSQGCTRHPRIVTAGSSPSDWLVMGEIVGFEREPQLLLSFPDRADADRECARLAECGLIKNLEVTNWSTIHMELEAHMGR